MDGTLIAVTGVHWHHEHRTVVVETYERTTLELLDDVRFISTRRIKRGTTGRPDTPQDEWGVVPIDAFTEMGGFLKRSPRGTLSFMLPWGTVAEVFQPSDFVFYSCESAPVRSHTTWPN